MSTTILNPTQDIVPSEPKVVSKPLRPRRTINNLALAVLGLMIGLGGQYFFNQDKLWDGLLLYSIAVILFVKSVSHQLKPQIQSAPTDFRSGLASGWRQNVGLWLIVMATGTASLAYWLFSDTSNYPQGWWVYMGSIMLLVGGVFTLTKGDDPLTELKRLVPNQQTALMLAAILLIAMFMRLYNFYEQPFGIWFDESAAGLQARLIVDDPDYRPIFFTPINVTGHLLRLYAFALDNFGDTIQAMRLVSVAFGLGAVFAAYLFGRELHSPNFGLILAFLLAVMRWHVNFSRIAMTGIDAPFFELVSLFFLVRLTKYGRLRDALGTGLALGFGLTFYTAFRLYIAALVAFVIIGGVIWSFYLAKRMKRGDWKVYVLNLLILLLAMFMVLVPVFRFNQDNPDEFWYRVQQTSILTKRDQADLQTAIWNTTSKHLMMFNVHGDNNGRHNLPGAPMLDPLTGVLMVLGFGLALFNIRQPVNLFFMILFPATIAGGILSLDFEAPQSLRSIGVIPVVIYFSGLSLYALGREAQQSLRPLSAWWMTIPTALLVGYLFYSNANTYLIDQANDFASWNAFSTPETIAGHKMAELGPNYIYYSSPFLTNHPTTLFLAPEAKNQHRLTLPDPLPIREAPTQPVALFIHPDDQWIFDQATQLYPQAQFDVASNEVSDGPPVVYFANLSPSNIASIQGLELTYHSLDEEAEFAVSTPPIQVPQISVNWPNDVPPLVRENLGSEFRAEWEGILYVPRYGPYSFRLITPAGGRLEVDGNVLLDRMGQQSAGLPLAQGNHALRVVADGGAAGQVALYGQPTGEPESIIPQWWLYRSPVSMHGLLGSYYPNDNWVGQPAMQRIDPFLDTYFHFTPLSRPYSVIWSGSLIAPQNGVYSLGLAAVTEAELFINGQSLIKTTIPNETFESSIPLDAGLHELAIRFKDTSDRSRIHLYWVPPSGNFEPIPTENLWPPFGEYTPPVEQMPTPTVEMKPLTVEWLATIGGQGNALGLFNEPRDVAVLSNGNLVVADTANKRVQILDPVGNPITEFTGEPADPFEEPLAVAVTPHNEILVLDSTLQWIYKYDQNGTLLALFGGPEARMFHPRGLTRLQDGTIAVADTGSARIAFFAPDGSLRGSIGGLGDGPGQLNEPTDVIQDGIGSYYIAEAENNRIQRLGMNGTPMNQWNLPPTYAYDGPHLAFGPDGSIFGTESQSRSLMRYAPDGNLIQMWQNIGPVGFVSPLGIYFDEQTKRLYLTDISTHQIYVFELRE
ncbi:PA14 domain-containing protein [Anaerolineales bacterium HSG25]|nr:PA14 domain-containing protein [Anaerolineales bacterium HSG25]